MILSLKMKSFFSSYLGCVLKLYIMDRRCSEVFQTSSSYVGRRTRVPPCVSQERGTRALIMCRARIISMERGVRYGASSSPVKAPCSKSTTPSFLLLLLSCNKRAPALLPRHRLTSAGTVSSCWWAVNTCRRISANKGYGQFIQIIMRAKLISYRFRLSSSFMWSH